MNAMDPADTPELLSWDVGNSDNDRRAFARWSISAAMALLAHGLICTLALRWQAEAGAVEPTATIVIELSPLLTVPEAQEAENLPVPQQVQAEIPPETIVEKDVGEKETVTEQKSAAAAEIVPVQPSSEEVEVERAEPPSQKFETVESEAKSDVELARLPEENDKRRIDVPQSELGGMRPPEQMPKSKPVTRVSNKPQKRLLNVTATKPQTAPAHEAATPQAPAISTPSNSNALPNWKSQVIGILERNKRYPPEAQARQEHGTSSLAFSLNRQGRVTSAHIAGSSGSSALDAETLSLVQRVQPFPPPPADVGGAQISLVVAIRYNSR
jgi:periplasmic protein TonB